MLNCIKFRMRVLSSILLQRLILIITHLPVRLIWLEWVVTTLAAVNCVLPILLLIFLLLLLWLLGLMVIWLLLLLFMVLLLVGLLLFERFVWLPVAWIFDNWSCCCCWCCCWLVGLLILELVLVISWLEMVWVWDDEGMTWKWMGPFDVVGFVISVSWSRPRRSTQREYSFGIQLKRWTMELFLKYQSRLTLDPISTFGVVLDTWLLLSCRFSFAVLAAVMRRIGCEHDLPSAQVESGQPHSNCFTRAAWRASRCFSISCPTMASTVSAVWNFCCTEPHSFNKSKWYKVFKRVNSPKFQFHW